MHESTQTTAAELAMSCAQYAAHVSRHYRKISRAAISKAIKNGNIPAHALTADGKILSSIADVEYAQKRRRGKSAAVSTPVRPAPARCMTATHRGPFTVSVYPQITPKSGSDARADADAALKQLELSRRQGGLVPFGDVEQTFVFLAQTARDRIMALPDKLSEGLSQTSDPHAVRRVLMDELTDCLSALSADITAQFISPEAS